MTFEICCSWARLAELRVSLKPRVFIAENVPAVEFGAHRKYWLELAAFLKEAGYTCTSLHLTASDFGLHRCAAASFSLQPWTAGQLR